MKFVTFSSLITCEIETIIILVRHQVYHHRRVLKYTFKMRIRIHGDVLVEAPRSLSASTVLLVLVIFSVSVIKIIFPTSNSVLHKVWTMEYFQDWAKEMHTKVKTVTSSNTTKTTMTTPAKLYGKDLSAYEEIDVEDLLAKLSAEEINILAKEVDPDDSFLPPSQRCSYDCDKESTGPLNRKQLIEHINKQAIETPDVKDPKPYVAGVVRGKKWIPPDPPKKEQDADDQITIDLGDEYESALQDASQEEIIDLAAILGFHSMMNQDQYHASLLNKGQPVGVGWDGITKASKQKIYPQDPPNDTDPEDTLKQVKEDSPKLIDLNWNNIKNISEEKFDSLFDALANNSHLEILSLTNVGLTDRQAFKLADALEKNNTLKVVNVETNFISPSGIVRLVKSLLKTKSVEEFRGTNQRSQVLGNKIEMEITSLIEQNPTLLRLGLHLEYNDARHRIAAHLQRNIDTIRKDLALRLQFRFFNHRKTPLIK